MFRKICYFTAVPNKLDQKVPFCCGFSWRKTFHSIRKLYLGRLWDSWDGRCGKLQMIGQKHNHSIVFLIVDFNARQHVRTFFPRQLFKPPQISRSDCALARWQNNMLTHWSHVVDPLIALSPLYCRTTLANSTRSKYRSICAKSDVPFDCIMTSGCLSIFSCPQTKIRLLEVSFHLLFRTGLALSHSSSDQTSLSAPWTYLFEWWLIRALRAAHNVHEAGWRQLKGKFFLEQLVK